MKFYWPWSSQILSQQVLFMIEANVSFSSSFLSRVMQSVQTGTIAHNAWNTQFSEIPFILSIPFGSCWVLLQTVISI